MFLYAICAYLTYIRVCFAEVLMDRRTAVGVEEVCRTVAEDTTVIDSKKHHLRIL